MKKTWKYLFTATVALTVVTQGCNDGFEPSRLENSAILALRAVQEPAADGGRKYNLEALTHEVSDLTWTVCPAPWVPTEAGVVCPVPEFSMTLPTGDDSATATLDLTGVPIDDGTPVYIRVDAADGSVVPAVMSVVLGATPRNPSVEGFVLDGANAEDWATATDSVVQVSLRWADASASEGATTAFFTTAGKFKPWRVVGDGSTELDFQGAEVPVTIYAITRYLGEGTTWSTFEVSP